jgi:putative N-acetylmannosamine-6-phosphate epimerase
MKKRAENPWQIASVNIVNLRFEIEKILDSFSEEEKKTKEYEDLMQTLDLLMEHVLTERGLNKNKKLKKIAISIIMIIVGAALSELTKIMIDFIGGLL